MMLTQIDQTLGQTLVTTFTNSSKLMAPSLSLSAQSIIWSTSAALKCYPTLAAAFSKSSAVKAPEWVASNSSKMDCREVSLFSSPPKPKISRKAAKSMSPVWPELLTMARICAACASRLRARMVLTNSSVETFPLPSQSKTSKTSLSFWTVSAFSFLLTYLLASKPLVGAGATFDITQIYSIQQKIKTVPINYLRHALSAAATHIAFLHKTKLSSTFFYWPKGLALIIILMSQKGSAIDLSEYIIRVYTDDYRYRLSFRPEQTYAELLEILSFKTGLPAADLQVLSENGRRLNIRPERKLKEVVYLRHGSILKVDLPKKERQSVSPQSNSYIRNYKQPQENSKVKTPCKHPPNMKCISCLSEQLTNSYHTGNGLMVSTPSQKAEQQFKCDHGPKAKCLRCLDKKEPPAESTKQLQNPQILATPRKISPSGRDENKKSPNAGGNLYINSLKKSKSAGMLKTQSSIASPKNSKSPVESPLKSPQKIVEIEKKPACLHGQSGKCLNCISPEKQKASADSALKKACNHGPNSKCIHCLSTSQNKVAHIAFDQYLLTRSSNCANNHSKGTECPNCQPLRNLRLQLNTLCDQHEPYPRGLCNRCLPENVTLKRQEYRHVDYVQFMNNSQVHNFINYWVQEKKMAEMRVAFIYGYYAQDPFYKNGIRAIVEAFYEPEQKCTANRFQLKDSSKKVQNLDLIAESLGLQKIGIVIASPNADTIFTQDQIRTIADFQQNSSVTHSTGYKLSNFFTVLIRPNKKDPNSIEPQVFMVSDQGQAMQAANLFDINPTTPSKMKLKSRTTDILPTVYEGGKVVTEFDLEFLLVKVASGASASNKFAILKNNEFAVLNRGKVKKNVLREYIKANFRKKSTVRYGDLNLLLLIAELIGVDTAMEIALKISAEEQIESNVSKLIDKKIESLL